MKQAEEPDEDADEGEEPSAAGAVPSAAGAVVTAKKVQCYELCYGVDIKAMMVRNDRDHRR